MLGKEDAMLIVALRSPVNPTAFTVHHAAPNLTFETGSAPRRITLEGYLSQGLDNDSWLQK